MMVARRKLLFALLASGCAAAPDEDGSYAGFDMSLVGVGVRHEYRGVYSDVLAVAREAGRDTAMALVGQIDERAQEQPIGVLSGMVISDPQPFVFAWRGVGRIIAYPVVTGRTEVDVRSEAMRRGGPAEGDMFVQSVFAAIDRRLVRWSA